MNTITFWLHITISTWCQKDPSATWVIWFIMSSEHCANILYTFMWARFRMQDLWFIFMLQFHYINLGKWGEHIFHHGLYNNVSPAYWLCLHALAPPPLGRLEREENGALKQRGGGPLCFSAGCIHDKQAPSTIILSPCLTLWPLTYLNDQSKCKWSELEVPLSIMCPLNGSVPLPYTAPNSSHWIHLSSQSYKKSNSTRFTNTSRWQRSPQDEVQCVTRSGSLCNL